MPVSETLPVLDAMIRTYGGDTFRRWILIERTDDNYDPLTELDVSLDAFKIDVRKKNGELLKSFAIGTGLSIDSPVFKGVILWEIPATDMVTFFADTYNYDFQWTKADGTVRTLFRGTFSIISDITE